MKTTHEDHCTCDQLPEFDMDGSRFAGRCNYCSRSCMEHFTQEQIRLAALTYGRKWREHLVAEYMHGIYSEIPSL